MDAIKGWQEFLQDGEGYLKTAVDAHEKRNDIFTAEIQITVYYPATQIMALSAAAVKIIWYWQADWVITMGSG